MNVILPICIRLTPQGVPPSGVQWPELMQEVKNEYYNVWKRCKKRYDEKDMIHTWTTIEWETFLYLGPRGIDFSFLRPGSLEDDDCAVDSSRAGAREVVKADKKAKFESKERVHVDENAAATATIAVKMAAHTKMSNKKLILHFGSAEEKARVLKEIMMDLTQDANAEIVIEEN